jgi:fatty-acid desaturase
MGLFIFPVSMTLPVIVISQIVYVWICGTLFFHRTVSHRNDIHPFVERTLLIMSWLGVVSSAIAWAGVHRKHHRFSDTNKDPHSPIMLGKFKAYWQMSDNDSDVIKYVPDLLRKPWYVYQHRYYFEALFVVHICAIVFLPFVWYWALLIVPAFLMWFGGSMINIFCHDDNGPRNVKILALVNGGEGWHKNHHDNPSSASFGERFDLPGKLHNLLRYKK